MKRLLVSGATGNVGLELIMVLNKISHSLTVIAGSRDPEKDASNAKNDNILYVKFDFTDPSTYGPALAQCDLLFLLRPPAIADVNKYFKPLIAEAKQAGVQHIVFISVQGVERSTVIPHHKIEALIVASEIPYTFLRPAYFMQNFSTTLRQDLVAKRMIYLPAGNARFTLVDVRDIGEVAAQVLLNTEKHINKKYELTANEKLSFGQMAEKLSLGLGVPITYRSPNLIQFFMAKRRDKVPVTMILVMIMLHYLPRFQKEPLTTEWIQTISGKQPISFDEFIADNKPLLM